MSMPPFDAAMFLGLGLVAGLLYFGSLWWSTRRFARGGRMAATVALMAARLAVLGGLLVLASLHGALPLLMMTLGVLIGRFAVMRRLRTAAP